jgi:hypothetical protein
VDRYSGRAAAVSACGGKASHQLVTSIEAECIVDC